MYIYILTNTVNGNQYVGQSVHDPLKTGGRVGQHLKLQDKECCAIHNAVKKYGRDAFDVEVIPYLGASQSALDAIERWQIDKRNTLRPNGYNIRTGGLGGRLSVETRQKIGESNKGKKRSVETREKMSELKKGKKRKSFHLKPFKR